MNASTSDDFINHIGTIEDSVNTNLVSEKFPHIDGGEQQVIVIEL